MLEDTSGGGSLPSSAPAPPLPSLFGLMGQGCSLGWLQTHGSPPASASQVLGLQIWTTMPGSIPSLYVSEAAKAKGVLAWKSVSLRGFKYSRDQLDIKHLFYFVFFSFRNCFHFCVLIQNLAILIRVAWNSLCVPGWLTAHCNPPASALPCLHMAFLFSTFPDTFP